MLWRLAGSPIGFGPAVARLAVLRQHCVLAGGLERGKPLDTTWAIS